MRNRVGAGTRAVGDRRLQAGNGAVEVRSREHAVVPTPAYAERDSVFAPDAATVSASQLTAFMRFCEERSGLRFDDAAAFEEFSIRDYRSFWRLFLDWSDLLREGVP